jgi:chromate transporter
MTRSGTRRAAGTGFEAGPERRVGRRELFLGYLEIGLLGFGGIAPWARHVIVEERGWLNEAEYAAILGVGQVLPGPNTMNSAVMIGDRFQGASGAFLALMGLMAMPLVIAIASVYARFAAVPAVEAALAGGAAGAAGLVIGTALKMAQKLQPTPLAVTFGLLAFAAVGVLQLSFVLVVVVLAPLSIAGMALERSRAERRP